MRRALRCLAGFFVAGVLATPVYSQAPSTAPWSGWVQCRVEVQAPGYTSRQTHSWEIAGAPSAGGIPEYPATWTVVGDATIAMTDLQRAVNGTRTTNASLTSARIGIFTRASDNRLVALLRSSQLSVPGGTTGTQTASGALSPQSVSYTTYEWRPLPPMEDVVTSSHMTGTGSVPVTTRLDPLQPANATGQAVCRWDFVHGGQPSPLPRPNEVARTGGSRAGGTSTLAPASIVMPRPSSSPRTITLAGFSGTGAAGAVPPRTITLAGFFGAGSAGAVPPRTITLAGFTGTGAAGAVPPRTITLAGFSGTGPAGAVPPRTIPLSGFSGTGTAP